MRFLFIYLFVIIVANANWSCKLPFNIKRLVINSDLSHLKNYPDIYKNYKSLQNLCVNLIRFKEGSLIWEMFLITNPNKSKGPFWFLPHDNENSAFKAAVYATKKYRGGFLAIYTNDNRYNMGQVPNRNFANTPYCICSQQKASSQYYINIVFSIINYYKPPHYPYLALHNNTDRGGISVLKESKKTKSFLAYPYSQVIKGIGLADEDSIIYIAGTNPIPPTKKIYSLLKSGLNVKYEYVTNQNNDCSMSNYVILNLTNNYYNIETQHGKTATQIEMINRLIKTIQRSNL